MSRNPLEVDLKKYRALVSQLSPHLTKGSKTLVKPEEGLKRGYGIPKLHKSGHPLRPIISSINSITSGAERFLKDLIRPVLEKCSYSVNSTKTFKEKFLNDRNKFDSEKHEIFSIDAVSLYTSINVPRTVEYILDIIYDDLDNYFPQREEVIETDGVEEVRVIKPPELNL